ncbi:MAG TPA: stage VI sporulation protein F, partial [Bacillales bacterium]
MDRNSDFFDDIEEKTNVKKDDVFQLANSVQSADLADEKTVRRLITQ